VVNNFPTHLSLMVLPNITGILQVINRSCWKVEMV